MKSREFEKFQTLTFPKGVQNRDNELRSLRDANQRKVASRFCSEGSLQSGLF